MLHQFEGCRLTAYQDCVNVWTIGYGWTQCVEGKIIGPGMVITQSMADDLLLDGIEQYENAVNELVTVKINQQQFDALVDLTYNIGISALKNSTLLKKLNSNNYNVAADEFLRWNKAGGKTLAGLTRRREAERDLFLS